MTDERVLVSFNISEETGATSMKQKRQHGKKIVQPHTIIKAVTYICLTQANM